MGKGFKIFLVILLSIIAIALSGILTILILRSPKTSLVFSFGEFYSENLVEEEDIEELKDIRVKINSADVSFETGEKDNINIKIYSDESDTYSIKDGEIVSVELKAKSKGFTLFKKSPRVVVTVPKTYDKNITVNGGVGDVKIEKLAYASLSVDKSVGDVRIESIDEANIKISTGDIKITKVNDLNVESTTGDIKIGSVNNSLKINSTTGDVKIDKADISENSSIKNNIGDIKIGSINDIYVDAKTNVGDTKIKSNNRHSEIELVITNNIGDIKVG